MAMPGIRGSSGGGASLTAVLNGFLSAYMESSFVRMYEHLTEPSVEFYPEG